MIKFDYLILLKLDSIVETDWIITDQKIKLIADPMMMIDDLIIS